MGRNSPQTGLSIQAIADDWLDDYNGYRPHESLGIVPPTQFMSRVI
jgi:putative transposase